MDILLILLGITTLVSLVVTLLVKVLRSEQVKSPSLFYMIIIVGMAFIVAGMALAKPTITHSTTTTNQTGSQTITSQSWKIDF